LENASLEEHTKEWLDLSRNKEVVRGTVILIGSCSHMKRVAQRDTVKAFAERPMGARWK
jgi:hypothetical protein